MAEEEAQGGDGLPQKEELQLIADLRVSFQADLDKLKESGPLPGCFFGDFALTRVVRGNGGELEKAKEWFQRFLGRYRADNVGEMVAKMTEKLDASGSQFGSVEMLPYHEEVQKYARFVYSAPKLGSNGDVVWYMPIVDYDRWSLIAEYDWSRYVQFSRSMLVLRCIELDRLSVKQKRLAQVMLVIDMADCSLDMLSHAEFDSRQKEDIGAFGEQIAANIIRRTVIVNAPQVVDFFGGLARMFMPRKFTTKVSFAKGDGFRDQAFVAQAGGKQQLEELYATRVGLVHKSSHLTKALQSDSEQGLPSAEELANLAKLRETFAGEFARREREGTLHSCFFGDFALTRVLRGNQGSLHQAVEWMHRSLAKMAECSVDALVAELEPKLDASPNGLGSIEMLPHYEEVKPFVSQVYSAPKLTPSGDVICYVPLVDYDRWGMMEELEWDKFVRFGRGSVVLRCLELDRLSKQQHRMAKCKMLLDLADTSVDGLSHKSFDKANDRDVSKFAEAVAANTHDHFIVVNPSWAISTLYSLFSMFIPRRILDKLHFQRGDPLSDSTFVESVGGQEQLEKLLASRKNLVAKNGYAQRAFSSDMDDRLPTDREQAMIKKLKERFADEFTSREATGRLHPCFFGDIALARVLRGNDNSFEEATEWFLRFLTKAATFKLDALVQEVTRRLQESGSEVANVAILPHYKEVHEHFRCIFSAPRRTPKGDAIWYLPLSDVDREKLATKVPRAKVIEFFHSMHVLRCMEVERLSRAQGRMVKVFIIIDVEGSGMGSTGLPTIPAWDEIFGEYIQPFQQEIAAEVIGPCYVLNAPWIMVKGYNWFKALIPEKLSRKFHMLDGDGLWDSDFVELMGGEAQLRYLFSSRVGLVEGLVDEAEGEEAIAAGDSFEKRRDVRPGQEVRWTFSVQAGYVDGWFGTSDLDFSVTAHWFPEIGEGSDFDLNAMDLGEEIRPEETYTAERGEVSGTFRATRAGVVLLRWSNAHSVLRRKSVRYAVSVGDATEDADAAPTGNAGL